MSQEQQKTQLGGIQLNIQRHMQGLQQAAAQPGQPGQEARDSLALYNKALKGEGGPLTAQEGAKLWSDMVGKLISSYQANPDMISKIPSLQEFMSGLQRGSGIDGKAATPQEGKIYTDAQGNRAKYQNGQYVPM